jgi:uncharacterized OB-fold protein
MGRVVVLRREEVDPDSIGKDQRYTDDFKVEIHFQNVCERCTRSDRPIKELCKRCNTEMEDDI